MRLVETGTDGSSRSVDVMAIDCLGELGDIADLGLTLAQGKQLVALVQQEIVTAQSRDCTRVAASQMITPTTAARAIVKIHVTSSPKENAAPGLRTR